MHSHVPLIWIHAWEGVYLSQHWCMERHWHETWDATSILQYVKVLYLFSIFANLDGQFLTFNSVECHEHGLRSTSLNLMQSNYLICCARATATATAVLINYVGSGSTSMVEGCGFLSRVARPLVLEFTSKSMVPTSSGSRGGHRGHVPPPFSTNT